MVEYVYALHDFFPEHEDEVSFRAGERIEVIEKDDQYGDGWWQVSPSCSVFHTSSLARQRGTVSSEISYQIPSFGFGCQPLASWHQQRS